MKAGHPRFYEILKELGELHNRKNTDYASSKEPLGNFYRVGEDLKKYKILTPGYEPLKVALIYMKKQLDAIYKMVGSGETGIVEGIDRRLDDIAVYSIICRILYEELRDKKK